MAKPMDAKTFAKLMKKARCTVRPGKGSHVVWYCACGQHTVTVTSGHGTVAPNVMRDIKHRMPCVSLA